MSPPCLVVVCVLWQGIKDRQLSARLHEVAADMVNQEWAMKRERMKAHQRLITGLSEAIAGKGSSAVGNERIN